MAGLLTRPQRRRRSFADRLTAPLPGPAEFLRILRAGGFTGSTEGVDRIPMACRRALPTCDNWLCWLGHASFLLNLGGHSVAVDPVLSERIVGAGQRLSPPGLDRLPPLDVLLITHNHYDHLDEPTVRRLPRDTPVVTPAGLGRWFRRRGFTDVTELDWWESVTLGRAGGAGAALEVAFVPAHHWSRRGLFDHCATLWGGWVLTVPGGPRVYHGGDSGYGPFFAEIGSRYPGIEVAMLGVGCYDPEWFLGAMHANPRQAVRAAQDVGAAAMVPMHWGAFHLSREPVLEPVELTRAAWAAAGHDPAGLWDLAVGESRLLPAP